MSNKILLVVDVPTLLALIDAVEIAIDRTATLTDKCEDWAHILSNLNGCALEACGFSSAPTKAQELSNDFLAELEPEVPLHIVGEELLKSALDETFKNLHQKYFKDHPAATVEWNLKMLGTFLIKSHFESFVVMSQEMASVYGIDVRGHLDIIKWVITYASYKVNKV